MSEPRDASTPRPTEVPVTDEEMAYHEAGHAVIHLLNGGTIHRISINRADPQRGTRPAPRELAPPADEAAARGRVAVALAGEAAGLIHHERRLHAVSRADYDAAGRALQPFTASPAAIDHVIATEAAAVRERLRAPDVWQMVETIAAALLRHHTIDGDEVARLVNGG